ncbi:hypothetical protein PV328_003922 [Microctonus aethiopoides]|uniref:Uncharacterized protein n=1 Tax=Microctonus aethiopoides TaxID=144406 RepID=A0AA39F9G2_9HYME|nr:hypothetical protein PV328_003922 [Microctonus aethiopoides]
MGRVSINGETNVSNNKKNRQLFDSQTRLKKKKRRKDLEQLRSNVLAAKQNLKRRSLQASRINCNNKLSKNSLKKTLNMFAEVRQENENKTQGLNEKKSNKNSKGKTICARLLPEPVIGIFKNGAKGKTVRRRTVTNRLLHRTNEAQIQTDVFKLLNGDEESYSSSNITSDDSGNNSENLCKNEKRKDKHGIHSTSHHHIQPFNVIKDNPTFNTASKSKWMSDYMRMKNGGKERQLTSTNVTENVQSDNKYKRRQTDCSHDSDNYHAITTSDTDAMHSPIHSRKKDDKPMYQEELLKNATGNKVKSIKRWGISPIYCYDELCAKITEENFSFPLEQFNESDPIKEIKDTLAALYVQSREQQTDSSINDKVSLTSGTPVVHQNQIGSTEFDSSHSSLQLHQTAESHRKFNHTLHKPLSWSIDDISSHSNTNLPSINGRNLMNFGMRISNETNKHLENYERKNKMSQKYIERQVDKPLNLDYILESSAPVDWNAIADKQKSSVRRKPKYMPTILRRSNAGLGVSVDINSNEFSESNVTKDSQEVVTKNSGKSIEFPHYTLNERANSRLTPSSISHIIHNDKKNKANVNSQMMHTYDFSTPKNKFGVYNNVKNNDKIPAYFKPKHVDNYQLHSRSSSCNFPLCNMAEQLPQNNSENIFQRYLYQDSTNVQSHVHSSNHITPQLHEMPMYSNNYIPNQISESLANDYYINPNKQEIARVASLDQLWNSHGLHWRTSNFGHNMNTNTIFLPTNTQEILRHTKNNYSDTNAEMNNNAVLHYLKGLSFEEDKINRYSTVTNHSRCCIGNKHETPEIYSNSQQPTKYYAVSKKNDNNNHVPQRIPIYLSNEKPQFMNKIMNEKPQQRVTILEQPEKYIAASHKLNFTNNVRIDEQMQNNSCSIPMKFNHDFSEKYSDNAQGPIETILTMANANIPIDESLNSQNNSCAREVLLENGRIGLFVPRNNHQNNQLNHLCTNNYNSKNKSTQPNNLAYHHHHHQDYYRR